MKRNYYIFSSGRIKRKENTILFENKQEKKSIPVEDVDSLYLFGENDLNSKFLDFAAKHEIKIHIFNYYGFYSGTYYPRETNLSGHVVVKQVENYLDKEKRAYLAKKFVQSAIHNMKRNLQKRTIDSDVEEYLSELSTRLEDKIEIQEIMSLEAAARKYYYSLWENITKWKFEKRTYKPPENPLNSLISFGNSLLYTTTLSEIYKTHLDPKISYLHEPFEKRFSLSLDISEIFKPIFIDRIIFRLINNKMISDDDFQINELGVFLNEEGRKKFVKEYDTLINSTILHRNLKRKVRYSSLIRLECYKIIKRLIENQEYKPLKAWW